ncbi:MAG: ABC transporter ATP-binding protein [Lachnospiraceae bacterium]|nr:ABC transporter ATP-binding protein [Lachnospiraceae bacterium]
MIEIEQISKSFADIKAVDGISAGITEGSVYGLIGTNGAGKSTLMRMMAGILKSDSGRVLVDGEDVFENPKVKKEIFYIPDDAYFFSNATPADMEKFYASIYERFDRARFAEMLGQFGLEKKRRVSTFSKGMKKQLSILLGVCAGTKYLFCDETFDGLDPVMRQAVKSIFAKEIEERQMTPVIASHNLRELEDICDHVGLLHKGGILFSKDLDDMKLAIHKVQCAFEANQDVTELLAGFDIMKKEQRGRLYTLTLRGVEGDIIAKMEAASPIFYEVLPLSLEEIFISETEVAGYDIKSLIL